MKFKSFVKFAAGIVAISAAIVAVIKVLKQDSELLNEQNPNVNGVNRLLNGEKYFEEQSDFDVVKEAAGIAIAERHESVSEVVKEAITNISNTEKPNNDEAIDDLINNLESLLK